MAVGISTIFVWEDGTESRMNATNLSDVYERGPAYVGFPEFKEAWELEMAKMKGRTFIPEIRLVIPYDVDTFTLRNVKTHRDDEKFRLYLDDFEIIGWASDQS